MIALGSAVAVVAVGLLTAFGSERTEPLPTSKERLTTLTTNRGAYWRVALGSLEAHPLTGVGAGSFVVEWRRERTSDEFARDAHSLYLETLGELGLVGGALLIALLAALILGVARRIRDRADPVAPVAAACLAAWLVHLGLDWTWEFPAVTLIPLMLAAAALQGPARPGG
jgi:O-antigen ligase